MSATGCHAPQIESGSRCATAAAGGAANTGLLGRGRGQCLHSIAIRVSHLIQSAANAQGQLKPVTSRCTDVRCLRGAACSLCRKSRALRGRRRYAPSTTGRKMLRFGAKAAGIIAISIGVAVVVPYDIDTSADLIEMADSALYRANQTGRNSIAVSKASLASSNITLAA